jgi:trimethylamine--corrinoid protein Co-methyltransferase
MQLELLTPEDVASVHAASIRLLAEMGVRFGSRKALEILAAAGARVDLDRKMAWMPETLVEGALRTTSGHFRLWSRDGSQVVDLQDGQIRGHNVGGCVRIFDFLKGEARDATQGDLVQLTVLLDALENIHVCRPMVYPRDFPTMLRDIFILGTMLRHTTKPYGVTAYSPENLVYILELTGVIAGNLENLRSRPFLWGSVCPDSPLSYSESTSNILMRYAELGLPVAIAPCPICGGTSPVTLAGTLAQLNAEFLAGLVLVQVIQPGIDAKYTGRPIPMDMRTGNATFGAVEAGMMSAGIVQLARRYRVCSDVYGLGTRSRALDEQSAYEKAINGLLVALAGADLVAAAGLLEDALTSSAEQLVIDNDILGMIFRAVRGIGVTPESLAVETIMKAGIGGSFLTEPHTLAHMRKELYLPKLASRPASQALLEAAADRVQTILASHQPKPLEAAMVAEIERILDRATRTL